MKRLVFLLAFFCFINQSFTQILPNNDFETWVSESDYEEPESWNTPNPFTSVSPILTTTVTQSTDAYSGNYSVYMETKDILFGLYQVPGLITLADLYIDIMNTEFSIIGGLPLQETVTKLTGVYKYDGANGDSATVLIYEYKKDEEGNFDTIGFGLKYLHDASNWKLFEVDMTILNTNTPDTFNVMILSSAFDMQNYQFMSGSRLYIDSLAIETNTGIINLPFIQEKVVAYPNPASTNITIKSENILKDTHLEIYTLGGNKTTDVSFENGEITIPVNQLVTGKYIYVIKKGNIIKARGTFIKK